MNELQIFTFWAAIFFSVFGGILGILGVWVKGFWRNDYVAKLLITDAVLAGTSIIVAVITKFLG